MKRIFVAGLILIFSFNVHAKNNRKIPIDFFNHMPDVQQPRISPDGSNIAVISNQNDETQVVIVPFSNPNSSKPLLKLGIERYRIENLQWANNDRLLVTVTQPIKIHGIHLRTAHLYSASIDGKSVFELRKNRGKKLAGFDYYRNSPRMLSLLPNDDAHILVTFADERDNNYSSVFKVDINKGTFEKYIPNSLKITNWVVSESGEILLGIGQDRNKKKDIRHIYVRKSKNDEWKMIKTVTSYETETFSPILYEAKTNTLIVLSDHELNKNALWRFNAGTGEFTKLLGEAPGELDVSGAITKTENGKRMVIGFTYNDDYIKRVYFDPASNSFALQMANLFSRKNLKANVYDWDKTKNKYIISTVSDSKPAKYFLLDKKSKKITPWFDQYPDLEDVSLSNVQPIEFSARDGMKLHGYLTIPVSNHGNPPIVLFPHGGPYARDSRYFDPFVQLFASRGYAVLQVNFRGSTGYGNHYQTSGYKQWGKKMQTDLIDAFEWVKKNKLSKSDKACIVGASYGGYAALVAGFQTPDLFSCIVSIAGVSDLSSQIRDWKRKGFKTYVEHAVDDKNDNIDDYSPINHIGEFKAPILLIHGKVDTRVGFKQSKKMYEALKKGGKKVDFELFEYGTHHLNDAVNRKKAMKEIDQFLAKYLK